MISDYLAPAYARARSQPALTASAVLAVTGVLTICGFFFFQYVLLILPCQLCLEQRISYYTMVPLAALLWLGAGYGASRKVLVLGFIAIMAIMLWNTGLSIFHAGVEYKFWQGPTDCSGPITSLGSASTLINRMQNLALVRCDEIAWSLFGITLAGYDAVLSIGLAAVAAWGAKETFAQRTADE